MLRDQNGVGRRRCVYETGYCNQGTPQQGRFAMTRLQIRQGGEAEEDIKEYLSPCRSTKAVTSNKFGCKLAMGAVERVLERKGGHPRHSARVDKRMEGQ